MCLVERVLVCPYTVDARTDTCLSFDIECFRIIQATAAYFVARLDFNDIPLSHRSQGDGESVAACSNAILTRNRHSACSALPAVGPHIPKGHRSAIGRGSICG